MKVKLGTIEVDSVERVALGDYIAKNRRATRAEVRGIYLTVAKAAIDEIVDAYLREAAGEPHEDEGGTDQ